MVRVKKTIFNIFIITVQLIFFISAAPPNNNYFRNCISDLSKVFGLRTQLIICVRRTIKDLTLNDSLDRDVRNYYLLVAQKTSTNSIPLQDDFCYNHLKDDTKKNTKHTTSQEKILENALFHHRQDYKEKISKYHHTYDSYGYNYLEYIAENVTLIENARLSDPETYCCETYPDDSKENDKQKNQFLWSEISQPRSIRNKKKVKKLVELE